MPFRGKRRVVGSNFQELQMAPLLFTTGNKLHRPAHIHTGNNLTGILQINDFHFGVGLIFRVGNFLKLFPDFPSSPPGFKKEEEKQFANNRNP